MLQQYPSKELLTDTDTKQTEGHAEWHNIDRVGPHGCSNGNCLSAVILYIHKISPHNLP